MIEMIDEDNREKVSGFFFETLGHDRDGSLLWRLSL